MATRYWVGGSGFWDPSTTTNWSATSGGPGGASAPTSADDVIFNASSGSGTVDAYSFAYAKSITCSSSSVTLGGNGFLLLYGNFTLQSTTNFSFTGFTLFYATATLISGGKTFFGPMQTSGSGVTLTLGDALNCKNLSISSNDSFVTNGYNVTSSGSSITLNGTSINLGASTFTFSDFISFSLAASATATTSSSNFVFQNGGRFDGGGKTYRFVDNTANSAGNALYISGTNTFSRLTLVSSSTANFGPVNNYIRDSLTITTFVCAGTSLINRIGVFGLNSSNGAKSNITLTVGTWTTKSNVDFLNVTAAGASAPWSGTSLGDCGGNSNISFTAAKTVYWNRAGASTWFDAGWALSSGGTPSAANQPLPQDTVIIDNSSAGTSLVVAGNVGVINASSRTSAFTLTPGYVVSSGNFTCGSGISFGSGGVIIFIGTSQTFTYVGPSFTANISVSNSQTLTSGASFSTTGSLTVNNGSTFNTGGYNIVFGSVNTATGNNVLALGSSTFTVTGTGVSFTGSATTSTTGTGVIRMSSGSAKTFAGAGGNYSAATLDQGGAGDLTITGANSFANITNSYGATGAATIIFPSNTTTTLGNFTASGTVGKLLTLQSSTAGTRATLSDPSGTISISYASLKDLNATGGAVWNAFTSNGNVDAGNNLGWIFVSPAGGNFLMFF